MTLNPLVPPDDSAPLPVTSPPAAPLPVAPLPYAAVPSFPQSVAQAQRLPFSKMTIWGFVVSCVSVLFLGFIGGLGVWLCSRGFLAAKHGTARGRGLAIAGMVIGLIGFGWYAYTVFSRLAA